MKATLSRCDVFNLINGERDYQDALPNTRTDGLPKSVGEYITMMQHYQAAMVTAWTLNAGSGPALDNMRKIAAIAVHCMEDHGAPARVVQSVMVPK
jgi:hypothetical protein